MAESRLGMVNPPIGAKTGLWTLNFIMVCMSNFSVLLTFYCLIPTLPIYIQQYGGSERTAGLALASLTASAIVIRPFTGWALDHYGRRLLLLTGLLVYLLPAVVYAAMIPVYLLLVFRVFQGFGWGILSTSINTVASDIIPRSRMGEGLGYYGLTTAISLAAAPAIGLWIIDRFSFSVLFIVISLLVAFSFLLALFIKYPAVKAPSIPFKMVFVEKQALGPALVMMLVALTYSAPICFLALYLREKGIYTAGLYFTVMAVTTLVSRPLAGRIVDRKGYSGYDAVVLSGLVLNILAILVLARTANEYYLVLGGVLYGFAFGFAQPSLLALSIKSVPSAKRGMANATYWTVYDIGATAGSVFCGLAAKACGYAAMFRLSTIPLIIALIFYLIYRKKRQPLI